MVFSGLLGDVFFFGGGGIMLILFKNFKSNMSLVKVGQC